MIYWCYSFIGFIYCSKRMGICVENRSKRMGICVKNRNKRMGISVEFILL